MVFFNINFFNSTDLEKLKNETIPKRNIPGKVGMGFIILWALIMLLLILFVVVQLTKDSELDVIGKL